MDTKAFEVLLFMTSLAQLRDPDRIVPLYMESMRSLFPDARFHWTESVPQDGGGSVEVGTRNATYGYVAFDQSLAMRDGAAELVHNSGQMLAVILERARQQAALMEQNRLVEAVAEERATLNESLEHKISERTQALESAYRKLAVSQDDLRRLNTELERRVEERTAEIERARQAMEAFSYTVSHDLRAPLRAIDGFARILKEDYGAALGGEGGGVVDRILGGAERMSRLIEAMLELSRLERRRIDLHRVDVGEVVKEVFAELEATGVCVGCAGCGRGASVAIAGLPCIESDPDLVRQVFANILGNACKFTRGRTDPRIEVSSEERQDGIWFVVADNGCGFDMARSDKLFQAFQRLHDGNIEGVGIGLATVKRIVDRLGGGIEAQGRPEDGATFRFRLEPAKTEFVQAG